MTLPSPKKSCWHQTWRNSSKTTSSVPMAVIKTAAAVAAGYDGVTWLEGSCEAVTVCH